MARRIVCMCVAALACSQAPPPRFEQPDSGSPDTSVVVPQKPFGNGEVVSSSTTPPPITAGTLLAARSGPLVFAANPDLGLVDVVDVDTGKMVWQPSVGTDSEPGRLTEDPNGLVWVALRRAGALAILDPVKQTVKTRPVCPSPRGLASTATDVWVACEGGELVKVPLDGGPATTIVVDRDLRDVIIGDGKVVVTRFRSAEVLEVSLGRDHTILSRSRPPHAFLAGLDRFEAHVAWRTVAAGGSIYELHQYASTRVIHGSAPGLPVMTSSYGQIGVGFGAAITPTSSTLVTGAVTRITNGVMSQPLAVVGAIDLAVSPSGHIALATNVLSDGLPGVVVFDPKGTVSRVLRTNGIPVGVAWTSTGRLAVQVRDPSELDVDDDKTRYQLSPSTHDTGFAIFHRSTGSGIACMSCHPEGGDDGHTWLFASDNSVLNSPIDARRTQSMRGGISSTAPFHWSGDMKDVSELAHEVFTERMGGDLLSESQIAVLARWLDWVPRLPAPSTLDPAAVLRGKALFESLSCTTCHRGLHFTDNLAHDVGTRGAFQTPSLVNVGARAPYIHDGCAPTLEARLTNPTCAGQWHGNTSGLSALERDDLVEFLGSL